MYISKCVHRLFSRHWLKIVGPFTKRIYRFVHLFGRQTLLSQPAAPLREFTRVLPLDGLVILQYALCLDDNPRARALNEGSSVNVKTSAMRHASPQALRRRDALAQSSAVMQQITDLF